MVIRNRFQPGRPPAVRAAIVVLLLLASACTEPASDKSGAVQPPAIRFTDVTDPAGLSEFRHVTGAAGDKWFPESMGSGGGFIDYDDDGWEDILLVGGGEWPGKGRPPVEALWLYHNNRDGTFTLRTAEAGLGGLDAYGFAIAAADYDNDGDQDFYFTVLGRNRLFRNEGGRFTEVGRTSGTAGNPAWSSSALFFDADLDGWVDLYTGNYVEWSPETDLFCTLDGKIKSYCTPELYKGVPARFYRNNGDGTFTDRTAVAGFLPAPGKTLGNAELDYNRDGWPDLVVSNDTQRDLLYENNGDGTFTEKGTQSGLAYDENGRARAGMGIDAGVIDQTGRETVFVGNFSKEMIGVYQYIGDGLFNDRAAASKIGRPSLMTLTFGLFLFDVDLDGDLDLFTANGHVQAEIEKTQDGIKYREPPHLFLNNGSGHFTDQSAAIGGVFTRPLVGRGAAFADYDRDGDLDILVTENGGPAHLWRNDTNLGHHWLRLHLRGRTCNRDAIGAQVTAVAGQQRMLRRIRTGSSFLSNSEKTLTFGLGPAAHADSLIVRWPGGGVQTFTAIPADQELWLTQGDRELRTGRGPGAAGSNEP